MSYPGTPDAPNRFWLWDGAKWTQGVPSASAERRTDMSGALLWYKCSETSAPIVNYGRAGSIKNLNSVAGFTFDRYGHFDKSITVPNGAAALATISPNGGSPVLAARSATLWAWVTMGAKPSLSGGVVYSRVWGYGTGGSETLAMRLYQDANAGFGSRLDVVVDDVVSAKELAVPFAYGISPGQAAFLAVVKDDAIIRLCVNGTCYEVAHAPDIWWGHISGQWQLGGNGNGVDTGYFSGHVHDCGADDVALSQAQLAAMYRKGVGWAT